MHLRNLCFTRSEANHGRARQSWYNRSERALTYGVPHHDVHVCTERIVHVLGDVEVEKITEVVVHVNTWCWERERHIQQVQSAQQSDFFIPFYLLTVLVF